VTLKLRRVRATKKKLYSKERKRGRAPEAKTEVTGQLKCMAK
jgi:hypothetical protein